MLFKAIAMPSAAAGTATLPHATAAATATIAATAFTVRSTPRNFIPPPPSAARTSAGGGGGSAAGGSTNTSTTATSKWPHPIASLTGCGLPGLDTLEAAAAVAGQPAVLAAAGRTAAGPSGGTRAGGGGATISLAAGGVGPLDFVSLLQTQVGITAPPPASATSTATAGTSQAAPTPAVKPNPLFEDKFTSANRQSRPKTEEAGGQHDEDQQQQQQQLQGQLQGQNRGGGVMAHPVSEYRGLLASSSSAESDLDLDLEEQQEEEEGLVEREAQGEGEADESYYGDSSGGDDYDDEEDGEDSNQECYDDDDDDDDDLYLEEESGSSTAGQDMYDSDLDEIIVTPSTSAARLPPPPPPRVLPSTSAAAATAGPASPPLRPAPPQGTPPGAVASSPPLTLDLMRQCRSLDSWDRLRISLRLERQLLNDTEVEMLAAWYEERAASLIEMSKLWLFDNRVGDRGAAAVARALLHPGLLELHLSHNVIGDKGAAALLEALPVERPTGLRPLWLRLEWNIINADLLQQRLDEQRKARGLISDVPQIRPSSGIPGGSSPAHENRLVLGKPGGGTPCGAAAAAVSVRLPWASCQKQPPSEAGVLRAVKGFYTHVPKLQSAAAPTTTITPPLPPAQPPPPPQRSAASSESPQPRPQPCPPPASTTPSLASSSTATPPPPAAPPVRSTPAAAYGTPTGASASAAVPAGCDRTYAPGPLLLFPDTSALISMLGGNTTLLEASATTAATAARSGLSTPAGAAGANKAFPGRSGGGGNGGPRPPLDWSLLVSLAAQGRFGRSLPLPDQVFIVVTDSVMKQLDGLKSLPETRAAVRRFMSEGLELAGPAGYDFLTVLGAHEGEGLALAGEHGGLMGLAGSRSPWLATRGQAVDVRIVEVALYYLAEVTRAYQQSADGNDSGGGEGSSTPRGSFLPVILLSNDNAQISAAKSHGLPAFRLTAAADLSAQLDAVAGGTGPLSSEVLRQLLAPQATKALGTTATRSLQDQFDCAVGTLRGVVAALRGLVVPLERISQLAAAEPEPESGPPGSGDASEDEMGQRRQLGAKERLEGAGELLRVEDARAALREIRCILQGSDAEPSSGVSVNSTGGLVSGLCTLVSGLQAELVNWEGVIRSHQAPSRLVQWAALGSSAVALDKRPDGTSA
ncbi:hypothetical protein Vretimale_7262 [Volvox reticuliferus]|uniref:Uncharacterized protein n=1 Tax=Volvox reticuliferus TaxID=1737510 RepID=A0A8J4G967_9CHLO|nr:hypothetical protein Vretimale_7262 [Volvox reticuliferus]